MFRSYFIRTDLIQYNTFTSCLHHLFLFEQSWLELSAFGQSDTSSICLSFYSNNHDSNCRNSNCLTHSHLVWIIYFYSTFFMTNSEDTNVDTICIWNSSFLRSILLSLKMDFTLKMSHERKKQNFSIVKLDAYLL